jgi:periplasmic protein TonB
MYKFLFFLLVPGLLFAQSTKKVTIKNENPSTKEIFFVLKSDNITKHGPYKKTADKNAILVEGYYKNGLKDSVWVEYDWWGKKMKNKGYYDKGNKSGIWDFYDFKGELEQQYDYSNSKIVFVKTNEKEKDNEFKIISKGDTIKTKLDSAPYYIGGSSTMFESLIKEIKYPASAKDQGISGKVFIGFVVNKEGKAINHFVLKPLQKECDEEALRVLKLIPDNWIPGILKKEAVEVIMVLPISFTLR